MSVVLGVYEVQLVTERLADMRRFYGEVLGLPVYVELDSRGRTHYRLGTGQLILAEAGREQVLPGWPGVPPQLYRDDDELENGPTVHGPVHFALHVDAEQWYAIAGRLGTAGVETRGPLDWGTALRSLYFRDPDGNCLELALEP